MFNKSENELTELHFKILAKADPGFTSKRFPLFMLKENIVYMGNHYPVLTFSFDPDHMLKFHPDWVKTFKRKTFSDMSSLLLDLIT